MRVAEGEAGVVDDHAHVADVVVEALELQEHDAQPRPAGGYGAAGERLEGLAVGERVADGRVAGDALGERRRPLERKRLEELFGALVDEAESGFEVNDRLALDAEAEVTGLDDAGVDGPHGDLVDALAFDAAERERLTRVDEVGARGHVATQRVVVRRPELMEGETAEIGVAEGNQAEQVVDLALEPARGERARGQRRERRGRRGHRHADDDGGPQSRGREHVDEREVTIVGSRVGRREELAVSAELGQAIGERRDPRAGQPARDRPG